MGFGVAVVADPGDLPFAAFAPTGAFQVAGAPLVGVADGIFQHFVPPTPSLPPLPVIAAESKSPAGTLADTMEGGKAETWKDAEIWQLNVPADAAHRKLLMHINYIGDTLRLYSGDQFVNDNFHHGDPMNIGLRRFSNDQLAHLQVKKLPYSDTLPKRLPEQVQDKVRQAQAAPNFGAVSVTCEEQLDVRVSLTNAGN